jgi:AcrR family transcriptional regulator
VPRPKDQAARREQLVQATLTVIATDGLAGVTMPAIARAAGISTRLVAYYYPDIEELVVAAHEAATERYVGARWAATEDDASPTEKLARLIRSGLPQGSDVLLSQALNELSVDSYRTPAHAALMASLFEREVALYAEVLRAGVLAGEFRLREDPELLARSFVVLEDGLGLHLLGHNASLPFAAALRQMASYACAVTGLEELPGIKS